MKHHLTLAARPSQGHQHETAQEDCPAMKLDSACSALLSIVRREGEGELFRTAHLASLPG